jgi:hypothetical protein
MLPAPFWPCQPLRTRPLAGAHLRLEGGILRHDTFSRIFRLLDPIASR